MSPPSSFPAPLPSPALEPPSSPAPNTEAQSGNATTVSSHAMSISSILAPDPPETPPVSRNNSFDENCAAEAPDTPQPILTTSPVTDPASAITQAERAAALVQLYLTRPRTHANDDCEAIRAPVEDESLNAALIDSAHAAGCSKGKGKGKGKDPELYATHPTEDGSIENNDVDRFTDDNAADILSRLQSTEDEIRAARVLLDLGTDAYEINVCANVDGKICSESEDEGPLPPAARKVAFITSCHGNDLQHFAHKGNAVFDLVSQRKQKSGHRRHTIELDGEEKCHCEVVQESVHARYLEGYTKLGYERFGREDTVPLDDDDAVDSPQNGRHGAAEYDSERYDSGTLSRPPKLSQKRIARLMTAKWQWRPMPDPLVATDSEDDTSVSFTDTVEPIRLPLYAEESNTRGSANGKAVTNPEASAEPTNASTSPPSPGRRPSYTDRRSGDSYSIPSGLFALSKTIPSPSPSTRQARRQKAITSPDATAEPTASTAPPPPSSRRRSFADREPGEPPRASDFVDCTKTISSPAPSTRQAGQKKPLTSSPLKRVESAFEPDPTSTSPEQHDQSARRKGSAPRSKYRGRGFLKTFLYRAALRNERSQAGAQEPTPPKRGTGGAPAAVAEAKAGPSTPKKKGQANAPPPTTCRKRKATTQAVAVEGQAPSRRKKQKGDGGDAASGWQSLVCGWGGELAEE